MEQEGEEARPSRLAEWLGVRAPTVSEGLRRLVDDRLVALGEDHRIRLTERGREEAMRVVRRHRILEVWLADELGLDWVSADEEAARLSPAISDLVLERLSAHLGNPTTCPHGNVVPGAGELPESLVRLDEATPGHPFVIRRISELAEHDAPRVLRFLFDASLVPGTRVEVEPTDPASGALVVRLGSGEQVSVSSAIARLVWVAGAAGDRAGDPFARGLEE